MESFDFSVDEALGSERASAAALQRLPHIVTLFLGPEHRIAALNETSMKIYGFNPIGLRIVDFIEDAEAQGVLGLYDRVFAGETIRLDAVRFAVNTSEGHSEEFFIENTMIPFRDRNGQIIGTLVSGNDVTERVSRERSDRAAADELNRRYRRATDLVAEIQQVLLPAHLPLLPGLDLAASYVVGGAEQAAGGDWFEIVPRRTGRVAAVVGDVVGHGVAAAAAMAQLRAVTLERLHAGAAIAGVIELLDRFVEVGPGGRSATVSILELDPASGAFEYAAAGHPPPLVVDAVDGAASYFVDPTGEPPLGATASRSVRAGTLGEGQVLLLYTDGIVERPGVPATTGHVLLRQVATEAVADRLYRNYSVPAAVDRATAQTLEHLTRETGSHDDITLLALQRVAALEPLHLELEISLSAVGSVRQAVRSWLQPRHAAADALATIDQIATELCENTVEHAYAGSIGPLTIDADLNDRGVLSMTFADRGAWRPPPQPNSGRGLGLAVVQQLAASLDVERSDQGTTVNVRLQPWKLSATTTATAPPIDPRVADVYVHQQHDGNTLSVSGPLDSSTLVELEAQLALVTTPGSAPLLIDLNDATVLSSATLDTIRRAVARAATANVTAAVHARPGTVAHQVLALAGIETSGATTPLDDAADAGRGDPTTPADM